MKENEVSILLFEHLHQFNNNLKNMTNFKSKNGNNLTIRQFFAMRQIKKHEKIELKNLSKELYVSTSSLCILLNKLVERGYAYRKEDAQDRRNMFYGLTEEGNDLLKEEEFRISNIISQKMSVFDNDFIKKLSEEIDTVEKSL